MDTAAFIRRFSGLGSKIRLWLDGREPWPEMDMAVRLSTGDNAFFTPWMQHKALEALAEGMLREDVLGKWLGKYLAVYSRQEGVRKVCGVVAAGNIPAVAFHDILAVLAAGWQPLVKLSSKDKYLLPVLFPPGTGVKFCDSTQGWDIDALLYMGGDKAAEHFMTAFPDIPKAVRTGRFSTAVLTGRETAGELEALAVDMLQYYGLGCRSVTCILVPHGYCFKALMEAAEDFASAHWGRLGQDNHRRNKAVLTLAAEEFHDSGTVIFRNLGPLCPGSGEDTGLCRPWGFVQPLGTIWYLHYGTNMDVDKFMQANRSRIQKNIRNFGTAQLPGPDDWPDGVDVLGLLSGI